MSIQFHNRADAGQQLAQKLREYSNDPECIVLALPRGGVIPAAEIARELNLPLDLVMVKKIGHPSNPEFAVGAVNMSGRIYGQEPGIDPEYLRLEADLLSGQLKDRYARFMEGRQPSDLTGKTAILVDDGIATGKTMLAACETIRVAKAATIIAAIPVGHLRAVEELRQLADRVVCLGIYADLYAIGVYYNDFSQVSDEEVRMVLHDHGRFKS